MSMLGPDSLTQNLPVALTVIEWVDVPLKPSSPTDVQWMFVPCTQFLGLLFPVRSRTQTVPLPMLPHSAPEPTTLRSPLPSAVSVEQLEPHEEASSAPEAGAAEQSAARMAVMMVIRRMSPVSTGARRESSKPSVNVAGCSGSVAHFAISTAR